MTAPATVSRGKSTGKAPVEIQAEAYHGQTIAQIPPEAIDVGPNVRAKPGELDDLVASIKEHGILQPIKVRQVGDRWSVMWGQRRYLAAVAAGLERIPALIELEDKAAHRVATEQLVENLVRADLNPIDEAKALRQILHADPELTQASLAGQLGRSAPWVANSLRLLETAKPVQQLLAEGKLSASHGKAIASLPASEQEAVAKETAREGYSAHDVEKIAAQRRRDQSWKAEQEQTRRKRIKDAVAAVKAKVQDQGTELVVSGYESTGAIAEGLRKVGYKNVKVDTGSYYGSTPPPSICDCKAFRVEAGYGDPRVHRHCVKKAHRDEVTKREQAKRESDYADTGRQRKAAKAAVAAALKATPLSIDFARLLYWRLQNQWQRGEWAKTVLKDVKRPDPWRAVCSLSLEQLVSFIGEHLMDYDVPSLSEPSAAPAKKGKAAA